MLGWSCCQKCFNHFFQAQPSEIFAEFASRRRQLHHARGWGGGHQVKEYFLKNCPLWFLLKGLSPLSSLPLPLSLSLSFSLSLTPIRGTYCAIVSAMLTNVLCPDLLSNTVEWIVSCQSYEGGFSAIPGTEAHGGYTFCGFATLALLEKTKLVDIKSLLVGRWGHIWCGGVHSDGI